MKHFILEIAEQRHHFTAACWDDAERYSDPVQVFRVSTRKLEAFAQENDLEYSYVQHIIYAARTDTPTLSTSQKYSFSDTPDWWTALQPDATCDDPIKRMSVEIICS